VSRELRIVGGVGQDFKRLPLSKFFWTWPFAVAWLQDDLLRIELRGPLRPLMRRIEIPLQNLAALEVRLAYPGQMRLRLKDSSQNDGVVFTTPNPRLAELIDEIEQKGVTVRELSRHV
jgi:hypothetical protein